MRNGAVTNDLFERLAGDSAWKVSLDAMRLVTDPRRFIGRASAQVDEFLATTVAPLLEETDGDESEALRV
jgi:adenylosuccinate lyase